MFFKCLQITKTAVLVKKSILIEFLPFCFPHQAGSRDEFDVNLSPLAGVLHLLVRLGDVFGIGELYSHLTSLSQKPVQAGDRTGIAPLPQLDPEHNQSGIGISASHVQNELGLFRRMLIRMAVGPVRTVR